MSRLDYVTIAIVAVCVAALIYLIYMTTGLLGGGGDAPPTEAEKPAEEEPYYDDYYPDEDSLAYEDDYGADSLSAQGDTYTQDRTGEDGQSGNYEDAQKDTYAPAANEDYPSVRKGEYMLLAGTFKYKANAETMVQQLKKMGYSNASVELFNRGAYAVALVDRYTSLSEARTAKGELSGKGVEAFVKQKQ